MKILWFTGTASLYDEGKHHYHGCGWIESLEELIANVEGINLGISFLHATDNEKVTRNRTTYYPIKRKLSRTNPIKKLIKNWKGKIGFADLQDDINKVIVDFKPDVIHVFGTEGNFSLTQFYTEIPVIYHIQGLINPILFAYLPVNQSKFSFHLNFDYLANTIKGNNPAFDFKRFKNQASREKKVLESARFVMGRTHWDKMVVKLFNPKVQYFHIDEVLRPLFYEKRNLGPLNKKFRIISTLSPTLYKGIDVVLKVAKQLKELTTIDFEWEIIGLDSNAVLLRHFEKTENIMSTDVNIVCMGKMNPEDLIESMCKSNVLVHPSYIDNSPNSVCEAQMLGLPVIVSNVGGISTLVDHEKTGFLVPSNGVFEIVYYICQLFENENLSNSIGKNAKQVAHERHNRKKIVENLVNVYSRLC